MRIIMDVASYSKDGLRMEIESAHYRVDLSGLTICAFGGGGNLAEHFLVAAAGAGARIALVDVLPEAEDAADKTKEHLFRLARTIAYASQRKEGCAPLTSGEPVDDSSLPSDSMPPVIFADVRNGNDVDEAVEHACSRLGKIDIGLDFAGIHHPSFDLAREETEDLEGMFRRVVDINLTGAFLFTASLARRMVRERRGHIIHLCSNGSRLSLYGSYAYTASKHGLEGLVKTAAAQLSPYGVRVNAIAPGTVETNLNRELLRDEDGELKPRAKSILAHTPSKKFCSRWGVTTTLLSMCVPQPHLTGNVLFADDGYNIEGHSWPEGNKALFSGKEELDSLFSSIDREFPPPEDT